jgi:hypothetical protein
MKLSDLHARLLGAWQGEKRLWMEGEGGPVFTSASRLVVTPVAKGSFLSFAYSWAFDGKAQEGLLIVGNDNEAGTASAAWGDSFHMNARLMVSEGGVEAPGVVSLSGHYAAPPGPDWGWRITLDLPAPDGLRIVMHNIEPSSAAHLAVQADFTRAPSA